MIFMGKNQVQIMIEIDSRQENRKFQFEKTTVNQG